MTQVASYIAYFRDILSNPLHTLLALTLSLLLIAVLCIYRVVAKRPVTILNTGSDEMPITTFTYTLRQRRIAIGLLGISAIAYFGFTAQLLFAEPEGRKAPPADDALKEYENKRAAFSLVEVFKAGWTGGGAFARIEGSDPLPLAIIIDPKKDSPSSMLGTSCALKFDLEARKKNPWVDIDNMVVDVIEYKPLPKYEPIFPAPFQTANVYYVEIDDPKIAKHKVFGSSAIYSSKGNRNPLGTVRLDAGKPEHFFIRINARRPGIYTLAVHVLVSHKQTKERVTVVDKQSFLFDGK